MMVYHIIRWSFILQQANYDVIFMIEVEVK